MWRQDRESGSFRYLESLEHQVQIFTRFYFEIIQIYGRLKYICISYPNPRAADWTSPSTSLWPVRNLAAQQVSTWELALPLELRLLSDQQHWILIGARTLLRTAHESELGYTLLMRT